MIVPTDIPLFDLGVGELDLIPLTDPIDSSMPPFNPVLHVTSASLSLPLETLRQFAVLLSLLKDRRWVHTVYEAQYMEAMTSIKQVADAFAEVAVCGGSDDKSDLAEDMLQAVDSAVFLIALLLKEELTAVQEQVDEPLLSSLISTLLIVLNPDRSCPIVASPHLFSLLSLEQVVQAAVRGVVMDRFTFHRKDEERRARYQQILFL